MAIGDEHRVRDRGGLLRLACDFEHRRVTQELIDQRADFAVECGREQQFLAVGSRLAQDALHGLDEAELGHVIGFVEDSHFHSAEIEHSLLDEILDAPRRSDQDVDASVQRLLLQVLPHTAGDNGSEDADGTTDRLHVLVDLVGQFTRRCQNERPRRAALLASTLRSIAQEVLDNGCAEGDGLTAAGAATPEDVAAGQGRGDGRRLDRERLSRTERGECSDDAGP